LSIKKKDGTVRSLAEQGVRVRKEKTKSQKCRTRVVVAQTTKKKRKKKRGGPERFQSNQKVRSKERVRETKKAKESGSNQPISDVKET